MLGTDLHILREYCGPEADFQILASMCHWVGSQAKLFFLQILHLVLYLFIYLKKNPTQIHVGVSEERGLVEKWFQFLDSLMKEAMRGKKKNPHVCDNIISYCRSKWPAAHLLKGHVGAEMQVTQIRRSSCH